jgi:dephospho-CoA kinase
MPGSGKSTAVKVAEKMDFRSIEMGDVVRDRLRKKVKEVNNYNLREFAIHIRKRYGKDIVAKWTAKYIEAKKGNLLIVGIRNREELAYFRKRFKNICVVLITAPARLRYSRMKVRKRADDPKNFSDFMYRERKERLFGIKGAINSADYIVSNAGDIATFREDFKELVIRILGKRLK